MHVRFGIPTMAAMAFLVAAATGTALAQIDFPPLPNPSFEETAEGVPATAWQIANWGPAASKGSVSRDDSVAHLGDVCLRTEAQDDQARPGVFTKLPLPAQRYQLRFYARAHKGTQALVRAYLADHYGPARPVGQDWTEIIYRFTLERPLAQAEINLQYFSGRPGVLSLDDLELKALPPVTISLMPDARPQEQRPGLLYASANANYLREHPADWAKRGFTGFFISYVMHDWKTDVWAQDAKPESRGGDDQFYLEMQNSLRECRDGGLPASGIQVGLYSPLPDPYDEEFYSLLRENFRQGARFARGVGVTLMAIDTKYAADEFSYSWAGYAAVKRPREEFAQRFRERWRDVGRAIAEAHPRLQLAVMPEGVLYYGPLWSQLFAGLIEGYVLGGGEANVYLMCEGTFDLRNPEQIRDHAEHVRAMISYNLDGEAATIWKQRGKVALGAWPLGYYRAVTGPDGKLRGYSGKSDRFGDTLVGPFADKSARYPVEQFRTQLAALRTFSDGFCWIYGHGSSWWQVTPEDADRYAKKVNRFPRDNYLVPTVSNLKDYYQITSEPLVVGFTGE